MIVILEGLDRCGKSTQIRKLQPLLTNKPLHIMHYMAIKGLDNDEQVRIYSSNMYYDMFRLLEANYKTANFLLDRSHLGEAVYSPMYRSYDGLYVFDIEKIFQDNNPEFWDSICLITFVDDPKNLASREDGLSFSIDLDNKQKEIDAFKRATKMSNIKHKLVLDINGKDEDAVFEEIKAFLKSI